MKAGGSEVQERKYLRNAEHEKKALGGSIHVNMQI